MVDEGKTIVNARAFESEKINHIEKLPENNGRGVGNSRRREWFCSTFDHILRSLSSRNFAHREGN